MDQRDKAMQPASESLLIPASWDEAVPVPATHSVWRRMWPAVGAALIWASRELLPQLLAAWRAGTPESMKPKPADSQGLPHSDTGRQGKSGGPHRWGAVRRGS
jgi:hypothetical protein